MTGTASDMKCIYDSGSFRMDLLITDAATIISCRRAA